MQHALDWNGPSADDKFSQADDNTRWMMNRFSGLATVVLTLAALIAQAAGPRTGLYQGPCDASAATALDAETFAVGADEGDTLTIYRRSQAAAVGSLQGNRMNLIQDRGVERGSCRRWRR